MKELFSLIKNFQVFIILSFLFCINIYSQPYYFYSELISPNYNNIYRANLSNGQNELFLSNIRNPLVFTYDNYQKWFFVYNKIGVQIFRPDNPVCLDTIIKNEQEFEILAYLINSKNLLFLSTLKAELNDWTFETYVFNSDNLTEIRKNKISISDLAFSSKDDNFLYQYDSDSISGNYFSKYSIELDSIIDKKYFYEISNNEWPFFDDGKKGMVLLSYNETEYSNTPRYFVYDIDNDLYFPGISFHYRSHGYLSPNSDFVILQKALWAPERPHAEFINGEISIYKANSGELVRNLVLPPDGKILLFDSYPDKFFYYVQETQQAITIDLSKFENEFVLNSLSPSTAVINAGPFAIEVKGKGFDSLAVVYFNEQPKTTTFVSDSVLIAEILTSDVSAVGTFPVWVKDEWAVSDTLYFTVKASSPNLFVNLKSSTGTLLTTGLLQYYQDSWKDALNNGDGTFTVITNQNNVSLRMTYEYAQQTVNNIPAQNNTYTFQTVAAVVQLKNSLGNLMPAPMGDVGTVQYYAGAWRNFGTITNGIATKELLPLNYSFRMTYEFASIDKQQNLSINPTVVFQTVNASVQLKNSLGNFIDVGTVQYYASAWRSFGTTTNGVATKELLPINYSFRMTYAYASIDKQQNLSVDPTVVFQTANAQVQLKNSLGNFQDVGTAQYYSGAWRSFGTTANGVATKELLPINYSFRMTYEFASIDKQQNLSSDPTVVFQTVNAQVQLKNSLGNLMPAPMGDVGTVLYYAGAWRSFGTTTNGVATKELLPINYSFRMTHEFLSKDKQQNLNTNPVVEFATVLCSVKVSKTNNQPLNNSNVKYYAGSPIGTGWRDLGVTNADGITTKELLPQNISFRASYGNVSLDKQQNIGANSLVEILLNVP